MAEEPERGRISVLIVDDHRLVADGLASVISQRSDMQVVGIAGTAAEAELLALEQRPNVILMDYGLPDGNGVAATQRIRRTLPETKVVMVTSFVDDAIVLSAIEAGCVGYIPKEKPSADVLAAIRAAADGEALIPPAMLARLLPRLGRRGSSAPAQELSAREIEVLRLMAEGLGNKEMGKKLHVTINTIRNHVQNILVKLNTHSKLEAVAAAVRQGIIGRV
jgi:DNA-binding NarL/FixJ family response regulator